MSFYVHEDLAGYQRFDIPADLPVRKGGTIGAGEWMELKPASEQDIFVANTEAMIYYTKLASLREAAQLAQEKAASVVEEEEDPMANQPIDPEPPLTEEEALTRLGTVHLPTLLSRCCRSWSLKSKPGSDKNCPITPETCARLPQTMISWAAKRIACLTTPLAKDVKDFSEPPSDVPSEGGSQDALRLA